MPRMEPKTHWRNHAELTEQLFVHGKIAGLLSSFITTSTFDVPHTEEMSIHDNSTASDHTGDSENSRDMR